MILDFVTSHNLIVYTNLKKREECFIIYKQSKL